MPASPTARYPVAMTKTLLAVVGSLMLLASCGQAKRDLTLTYFNMDG